MLEVCPLLLFRSYLDHVVCRVFATDARIEFEIRFDINSILLFVCRRRNWDGWQWERNKFNFDVGKRGTRVWIVLFKVNFEIKHLTTSTLSKCLSIKFYATDMLNSQIRTKKNKYNGLAIPWWSFPHNIKITPLFALTSERCAFYQSIILQCKSKLVVVRVEDYFWAFTASGFELNCIIIFSGKPVKHWENNWFDSGLLAILIPLAAKVATQNLLNLLPNNKICFLCLLYHILRINFFN